MSPLELLLREVAPEDLDGRGCYPCLWLEIASDFPQLRRDDVYAYYATALPFILRDWLEAQGRWNGPGFATIIYRDRIPSWRETLGVCLHEFGHWLADGNALRDQVAPTPQLTAALENWVSREPQRERPWDCHEADFLRACCHLAHRAGELLESIRPSSLRFSMAYTGVSEATWMTLLEHELGYRGSIRELLATPAPQDFLDAWGAVTSG